MLTITAIVWQSYYNGLFKASQKIKDFRINLYSARILERDFSLLECALRDLENSDIVFLYRSTEGIWEEIERKLKELRSKLKILSLGNDPASIAISNVSPDILSTVYRYLIVNGEKNLVNLFLYIANRVGGMNISYEPVEEIPWEGLYHPRGERVFRDVEEYLEWYRGISPKGENCPKVGILFSRLHWINGNIEVERLIIDELERNGVWVIPGFAYAIKDASLGNKGMDELVLEWFLDREGRPRIDGLIKSIFFLLGSRREKYEGKDVASEGIEILKRLNVPIFCPIQSYFKTVEEWEREELNLDIAWTIALPEFEGVIEPIIVSAQREGEEGFERRREPIEERVEKFVRRVLRWLELRRTPPEERRVAFILHNNPCASVEATVGSAAHLDSLESVVKILKRMKEMVYRVEPPESGKELIELIMGRKAISEFRWTTVGEIVEKGGALALVEKEKYLEWFNELPPSTRQRVIESWGEPPGEYKNGIPPAMVYNGKIVITGVSFGNAVLMVQPKRGCAGSRCDGQVCKILHDPDTPPPHQYIATYKWLSRAFKAHCIVHVGTHGNLEFLPGKGVALSNQCLPDICIDTVPHLYIYNADNPPEGTIAKRRSYAVLVDHMQTVLTTGGLYDELLELDRLLGEYEQVKKREPSRAHILEHLIIQTIRKTNLDREIKIPFEGKRRVLSELTEEELQQVPFELIVEEAHSRLSLIRNTQIQEGMHIFGRIPEGERRVEFIYSILRYDHGEEISLRREIAKLLGYDLKEILAFPQKIDERSGKSYGEIAEEIDGLGKEIIREILKEVKGDALGENQLARSGLEKD